MSPGDHEPTVSHNQYHTSHRGTLLPKGMCQYCRLGIKEHFVSVCDSKKERKRGGGGSGHEGHS